jgi:hypothetical protein
MATNRMSPTPQYTLDVARSVAAAERISVQKKGCYANALLTMHAYQAYQRGWYVEGFAIPDIQGVRLPLEHGWVELPDGTVIDPSFAALGHREVSYFPAIRLPWKRAEKLLVQRAVLPWMLLQRSRRNRAAYYKAQADSYSVAFGKDYKTWVENH